jgi:hypothetical protein
MATPGGLMPLFIQPETVLTAPVMTSQGLASSVSALHQNGLHIYNSGEYIDVYKYIYIYIHTHLYLYIYTHLFSCAMFNSWIDSAQAICCEMVGQEKSLAVNFREIVMRNATIKNGRIVIPNGMVTFEH